MSDPQPRSGAAPCAPCAEKAIAARPRRLTTATLGLDDVPRHAPGLGHWRRDGEVVVTRGDGHPFHVLNASAGMIWLNLDGTRSVGDLVAVLHEHTGAPADVLERDVRAAVVQMAGVGILVVDPAR